MRKSAFLGLGLIGLALVGCASTQTAPSEQPAERAAAPVAPAARPTPMAESSTSADETYTVMPGDNLWAIAGKPGVYGDPYQWPLLYRANRDRIEDADLINPGQVLTIRRNASSIDVQAAVRHARARGAWRLGVVEQSDRSYLDSSHYANR